MKIKIQKSDIPNTKRLRAEFSLDNGTTKTVYFGLKGANTFLEHRDENKKRAWIARHRVRGTFDDPMTASSLSRYILWNKPTITESIRDFKHKFNLN